MADDAAIRLKNFRALWASKWSPTDAARQLGRRVSFWSDLYRGEKSFGEKLAREIEERMGLVRLSLDDPEGARAMPLSSDVMSRLEQMPPEERRKLENMLRVQLDMQLLPPHTKQHPDAA